MPKSSQTRFVFITGGVVSSLGKGLTSASLGTLLQARGYSVRLRKLDPYLNLDPGTMSPTQHGECYVTDDGAETDLDLGHYERFTGVDAKRSDNITTGQIYSIVLGNERKGQYLGGTVQVIPHVTDVIKSFIINDTNDVDFVLCEIGGTVGDIEGLPFLEAIRQLRNELGRGYTCFLHVTLLPYIAVAGEIKTKPTQHSVKELLSVGIQADVLLCRTEKPLGQNDILKISRFCNISKADVIEARDVKGSIYQVPVSYHEKGLDTQILNFFGADGLAPDLQKWTHITERLHNPDGVVRVSIVGKYVDHQDAYKSLREALVHGGVANNVKVELQWISSEELESGRANGLLSNSHAILVPGGFGERGSAGKILAVQFARERKLPFFGICFGMQLAVVEICRNLLGITGAGSTEFGPCSEPVVGLLREWIRGNEVIMRGEQDDMGGTMRLGSYPCEIQPGSKVAEIYGATKIQERHRHRYEVNIGYVEKMKKVGVDFTGISPDGILPEILELQDHPWFIGVQYHPELKSRPFAPHPLFASFIAAALAQSRIV
ncbi:MAG: CTP synthase [Pseudomonadota bacterium]